MLPMIDDHPATGAGLWFAKGYWLINFPSKIGAHSLIGLRDEGSTSRAALAHRRLHRTKRATEDRCRP